jgi:hypothetical protein
MNLLQRRVVRSVLPGEPQAEFFLMLPMVLPSCVANDIGAFKIVW